MHHPLDHVRVQRRHLWEQPVFVQSHKTFSVLRAFVKKFHWLCGQSASIILGDRGLVGWIQSYPILGIIGFFYIYKAPNPGH